MIKCLICTIIIEVLVAIILKIKNKKDLINVVLVNILTNPLVVSIPILVLVKYGYSARMKCLLLLEILTVITEGLIYLRLFNYRKINPFIVSLILNLSSYFIGDIINSL